MTMFASRRGSAALALCLALTVVACGSDDPPGVGTPRFALSTNVYDGDQTTTYITLLENLDDQTIDLAGSHEIAGSATIGARGGQLYVADGESPVVTRYAIDKGALTKSGEVSFAGRASFVSLDDWTNTFVSDQKAYMLDLVLGNYVVWDPSTMTLTADILTPELARLPLRLDGGTAAVRGDRMYRTFYWKDWDTYTSSTEQYLAVYDLTQDKLVEMVREERCPALSAHVERDEDDNLYFSNWVYNVTETLMKSAPASCALRLPAGSDRFDDWTLPFPTMTENRQAAALAYTGGGKGLLNVFHHERATIGDGTDPRELALSSNWRLWRVDLAGRSAEPVPGLEFLAGGYTTVHADGRTFVMVPIDDYEATQVYEITDAGAELRFDVPGWSYQLIAL
jgi:hypothetical protein